MKNWMLLLALMATLGFGMGLTGCEEDGPAEKAGEKLDEAGEDMKDGAKDAGDKIEEGLEKAGDEIEDATN